MGFISRIFLKGLLTLLPILLTLFLLAWVATRAEWAFGEPLRAWLPDAFYFPGMGVVMCLILVFLVGLMVNNYLTQKFFDWLEVQLEKMPVIRSIYSPIRDVTQLFARSSSSTAHRVVMVQMDNGGEVLGLVTRDSFQDLPGGAIADGSIAVFLPFSYGVGGFTLIVPKSRTRDTGIPADKAMQLAITGWIKG